MLDSRIPRLARPLLLLLLALALSLPALARPVPALSQGTSPAPTATPAAEEEEVANDALLAYFESDVLETEVSDLLVTLAFYADATFDLGFTFTELEVTAVIAGIYEETDDGFLLTALSVDDEEVDEPVEVEVIWDADDTLILVGGNGDTLYASDIVLYAVDYAVDNADVPVGVTEADEVIVIGGPYVSHLVNGDEGQVLFYVLNLLDDGSASLSSDYLNLEPPFFEIGSWSEDGDGFVMLEITGTPDEEYDEPAAVALAVGESGELVVGDIVLYPLVRLDSLLDKGEEATHGVAAHAPHWSYEGEAGPERWGALDPSFALCAQGVEQSPVDIAAPAAEDLANIVFAYQPSALRLLNNGHTVQVDYDAGSYIELDGRRYDVAQFHYHAPSEHTINGQSFPAEFHIVHSDAQGNRAVIGLLVTPGAENAALAEVVANLPAQEGPQAVVAGASVDIADLLPSVQTTYRYPGSLTTPPCDEGVSWLVMTTPIELSPEQIAAFEAVHLGNNRPVQPLHERELVEDTTP